MDRRHASSRSGPAQPGDAKHTVRTTGIDPADGSAPAPGGARAQGPATEDSPLRVLLVEDSPLIRERLAESIAEPGRIEVVGQADSEQAAIGMLAAAPWDAMVLDLQLRHGTGLGVLRALISRRPPDVKVIVLTNYAFPQYRAKSLALGADYFFDKAREYHRVREVLDHLVAERGSGVH
ncbi:MAG: response regulator [Casimicrobiaceae bacterium]